MDYFEKKDVGPQGPSYYCRTYLSANHPKDYYSCSHYNYNPKKNQHKKEGAMDEKNQHKKEGAMDEKNQHKKEGAMNYFEKNQRKKEGAMDYFSKNQHKKEGAMDEKNQHKKEGAMNYFSKNQHKKEGAMNYFSKNQHKKEGAMDEKNQHKKEGAMNYFEKNQRKKEGAMNYFEKNQRKKEGAVDYFEKNQHKKEGAVDYFEKNQHKKEGAVDYFEKNQHKKEDVMDYFEKNQHKKEGVMDYFEKKDVGPQGPSYYCRTYLSANHPKDYYSCSHYNYNPEKNQRKKGGGINGKRFPELEKESLFLEIDEARRKFISARKKPEPALTRPYGKKCHGYKHSYNKGHCDFLEAFQRGSGLGEKWINEKIPRLSKTPEVLEVFQELIKVFLKEAAQQPKTKLNAWTLGYGHGVLLRLQRLSSEDS